MEEHSENSTENNIIIIIIISSSSSSSIIIIIISRLLFVKNKIMNGALLFGICSFDLQNMILHDKHCQKN